MKLAVKIALVVLILVGLVALVRALPAGEWLGSFQGWVTGLGIAGYVVFALVYAACVVLFVPASVLTLGAGAVYGVGRGTAVVLAGATLGATAAFLLARSGLRAKVERWAAGNPRFSALDRAIGKEGAKIVFLIRLSPIFPFTYINYVFGLTAVRTVPYVLASFFGMIPGTFAYVYLGTAAAGAASAGASGARTILNIAGAAAALIATLFVARVASRAIRKAGVEKTVDGGAQVSVP